MSKFRIGNTKASRLTPVTVMEIREKWATREYTQERLSRMYGVTINTIRNVINGVTWQHLPPVIPEEQTTFEAQQSQKRLSDAPVIEMTEEQKAKLMKELAEIDSPPSTGHTDPITEYLNRSQKEGSK